MPSLQQHPLTGLPPHYEEQPGPDFLGLSVSTEASGREVLAFFCVFVFSKYCRALEDVRAFYSGPTGLGKKSGGGFREALIFVVDPLRG